MSLKKYKDSSERESSRREVHVKQVETEANKGLDALRDAEERIAMLRTQVEQMSGSALSQLISISLFLEGEGGWELAEQ